MKWVVFPRACCFYFFIFLFMHFCCVLMVSMWICEKDENSFVNRKGFHSINVQAMTDVDYKFADIVARWPGSTHDSFIFWTSDVHYYLRVNLTTIEQGVVLGDSGYLLPLLMISYTNPPSHQRRFNTTHKTTRSSVERSIGQLKGALGSWNDVSIVYTRAFVFNQKILVSSLQHAWFCTTSQKC